MLIDQRELWMADTNTFVVAPAPGGPAVVIDAPPNDREILDLLAVHQLTPVALLITHGHVDHIGGAADFMRRSGVTAYIHPDDDFLTQDPESQLRVLFGMIPPGDFAPPDHYSPLTGDMTLDLAGMEFQVLFTPGHTPGHCCFYLPSQGVLFSGDQLFLGSVGRSDLPGSDYEAMMRSMTEKILPLPDDVEVLPGHGPSTTVGHERRTNPFLAGLG